ncbi:MAG: 30S ribosomal protein S5 [Lachnospiraceae bacterium]|nr:30S ribosomal protein S5 [Lachnospiraceae bacterium]MBR1844725.1 30S ribosomal protein S5 [Lachnospiraceae bacterium]
MKKEHNEIDKDKLELKDTVVSIKRISKTVKGGRTMRFSALVVVGDGNGSIGVGHGKSAEIPEAIRKGKEQAMRNIVKINLDNNKSVPHDYVGIWGTSRVLLKRSKEGTGVIAGGPVRSVMEMAGIQNIRTKSLGSRNKNNVALATINGLMNMKSPSEIATLRSKTVQEILAGIVK